MFKNFDNSSKYIFDLHRDAERSILSFLEEIYGIVDKIKDAAKECSETYEDDNYFNMTNLLKNTIENILELQVKGIECARRLSENRYVLDHAIMVKAPSWEIVERGCDRPPINDEEERNRKEQEMLLNIIKAAKEKIRNEREK